MKNLGPKVSNELLHRAFSIFGPVERAVVLVEGERAVSKGEGIVEFLSKRSAQEAVIACTEGHFALTKSLMPVVVEPYEVIHNKINEFSDILLLEIPQCGHSRVGPEIVFQG